MWIRVLFRGVREVRITMAVLVGIGLGALPTSAHAEICPNAASRSGSSASLPDCRTYEMVSPVANEDGNVYVPATGPSGDAIATARPFRASADGSAVAYVGDPSSEGDGSIGAGGGNNYLAKRAPAGGWTSVDIQPQGLNGVHYQAFSGDLTMGILDSNEILPEASVSKELTGYDLLYSRTNGDGGYHPLFTTKPPNRLPATAGGALEEFGAADPGEGRVHPVLYAGANSGTSVVPAFSHILFEANDALTGNAVDGGDEANNLYESVDGQLTLVNVLPSGALEPNKNATFGAPRVGTGEFLQSADFSHAISADGSRIFWSSLNSSGGLEDLYVREDGTETALIAEGGRFWTATSEGTKVFFTKGGLYEYDVSERATTDLTPGVEVLGVLGASENDEYIYYVDTSDNLNLWHEGVTTFIATLSRHDDENQVGGEGTSGDWQPGIGQRTAEAAPDGREFVFMSSQGLTGYANEGLQEVYVYDAAANHLFCASCDPSGAPPSIAADGKAAFLPLSFGADGEGMNTYQPRWISDEGDRVFFDSAEQLVPQDVNDLQDVYEWERDGVGSCHTANGCVYVLSGGTSTDISSFVDASSSGDDVFLVTRAQLAAQDHNENDNLDDVRVDGVQPLSPAACSGTGCQGEPSIPPLFATPPSATFNGVGNFTPPQPARAPAAKPKPKAKAKRCKKGYVKKRSTCIKKGKKKAIEKAKRSSARWGKRHV